MVFVHVTTPIKERLEARLKHLILRHSLAPHFHWDVHKSLKVQKWNPFRVQRRTPTDPSPFHPRPSNQHPHHQHFTRLTAKEDLPEKLCSHKHLCIVLPCYNQNPNHVFDMWTSTPVAPTNISSGQIKSSNLLHHWSILCFANNHSLCSSTSHAPLILIGREHLAV